MVGGEDGRMVKGEESEREVTVKGEEGRKEIAIEV